MKEFFKMLLLITFMMIITWGITLPYLLQRATINQALMGLGLLIVVGMVATILVEFLIAPVMEWILKQ